MAAAPEQVPASNGTIKKGPATWLLGLFLIVAIIGFGDAAYLTIEHYANTIPPCSVGGCESVLTSPYATVGPIPIALAGAVYYLLVVILTVLYIDTRKRWWFGTAIRLAAIGFVVSAILVVIQLGVLHAICIYCMGSAASSTVLFVTGLFLRKRLAN